MTQKQILENIKTKLNCRLDKELAALLNTSPQGFIWRMQKNQAGQPAAWLSQIISLCLDEMSEKKIEKVKKKLHFMLDNNLSD